MTSPRAQLLAPLGLSSCTACHNLEDDVKALLDEDVRYSKAPTLVKLVSGSQRDVADATEYHVAVRIARPRVAILNARNGVDEILEPRTGQVTFRLQWRASAWRVAEIEVIE